MYKIKLSSGNTFWYSPEDKDNVAIALVTSPNNEFVGGFAGTYADKRYSFFSTVGQVEESKFPEFSFLTIPDNWKKHNYSLYLCDFKFNDLDHMNGTSSISHSCGEREDYYNEFGLVSMWKSKKNIPMWAFVANHVSITSVKKAEDSWHFGSNEFKGPRPFIMNLYRHFTSAA